MHIDDSFGCVFVPDCIDIYSVGCHVTITNLVTIIIALVIGVSCLLTLSVNKRNIILNNAFFSPFRLN